MAVTSRTLKHSGPSGKLTSSGAEYTQIYHVTVNDPLDGPVTIFSYFRNNGPYFGSYYQNGNDIDAQSYVDSIDVPEHLAGSATEYSVQVTYKPLNTGGGGSDSGGGGGRSSDVRPSRDTGAPTELPWLWRPEVSIAFNPTTVPVYEAEYLEGFKGGTGIKVPPGSKVMPHNSAFVTFDPPIEKDLSRLTLRLKQWFLFLHSEYATHIIDSTNQNLLIVDLTGKTLAGVDYGFKARFNVNTLKISNVDASFTRSYFETIAGGRERVEYYETTIEVHYNPDGWDERVVDRGLHELRRVGYPDGSGGYYTKAELGGDSRLDPIAGIDGEPVKIGRAHV